MSNKYILIGIITILVASSFYVFSASGLHIKKETSTSNNDGSTATFNDKTWMKTFGGKNYEYGYCGQQTSDKGYIIIGGTDSFGIAGSNDIWLIKIDSNGNKQWDKTYGGSKHDIGRYVQQTNDGGYIITGTTCSYGIGKCNVWLIKTDENGNAREKNRSVNSFLIDFLERYPLFARLFNN